MRVGITDLPLHYGKAPKWLFDRMVKLSREISKVIVLEFGKDEFLRRISNPYFFQALGCLLGYDWHSSGLTTTTTAALKEALNKESIGIKIFGGKGATSRKTPEELQVLEREFNFSEKKIEELKYVSKMVAKVDNCAIQDGYKLYHHSLIVTEDGKWAVIQQGMNEFNKMARRYHWLSHNVKSFVVEPHVAIVGIKEKAVLNMVARESEECRKACVDLVKEDVRKFKKFFYSPQGLVKYLKMPIEHTFDLKVYKKLEDLHEFNPNNYEELLSFEGVGPKTVRALVLIAKLVYGVEACWKDPCKYSFAHGGKDKIPYPVDKKTYDESIKTLKEILEKVEIGNREKLEALKSLERRFSL